MKIKLPYCLLFAAICCFGNSSNAQEAVEIGRINTSSIGATDLMGVKIGPDRKIWFVDKTQRKVYRIDNDASDFSTGDLNGYFVGNNTFTEIASGGPDGLTSPVDLDFNLTRPGELWVVNQGTSNSGGSTSTFTDAGTPNQSVVTRGDGNAWHFMALASALAFGNNGDWATSQGILDANRNGTNFTGPTLWPGDMSIYGLVGNPPAPGVNGSHLDMLHQSPYSMGIAHEVDNVYWVFDGFNDNIVRYDFQQPHAPGGDYHGDAIVRRYTEVEVSRKGDLPAHLVLDKPSGMLFINDTERSRILWVDINTGSFNSNLTPANFEPLAEYSSYTGVTQGVAVSTNLQDPIGIDVFNKFMVVSDNATNDIIVYSVGQVVGVEDNNIQKDGFTFKLFPNPSNGIVKINTKGNISGTSTLNVYNMLGKNVYSNQLNLDNVKSVDLSVLPTGIYNVVVQNNEATYSKKLVLRH